MEKRMGILRRIVAGVLTLLVASSALYASGFEITGVGSKARAMGGAFRAVADDWSAAYYNPAGYAFIYDNIAGGNIGFLHHRNELIPDYTYGGTFESGYFNDREMYNKHEILNLPSAGVMLRIPTWNDMAVGLSAYQPFDNNIEWTLYRPLDGYHTDSLQNAFPINQFYSNLDVVAFQLTFAKAFRDETMSLGLGLQLLRADLNNHNVYLRENPVAAPISDRPRDRIAEFGKFNGNGWGFGVTAGLLYQASENMKIALTASLPFEMTIDGDAWSIYYMPLSDELNNGTLGDPENIFVNGETRSVQPTFETDLTLPAQIGGGISYQVNERLLLALDATYTFWSQFEGLAFTYQDVELVGFEQNFPNFFSANKAHPMEFNDAGRVAVGASYVTSDVLTLLAGISADQSATRDAIGFNPLFMDTGDKYRFNFGALFDVDNWTIGITQSYTHHPDLKQTGLDDLDGDGIFDNVPGEYNAQTYETSFSVNYRF